jgi:hypothetical protein
MDDASVDGDMDVVDFRRGLTAEQQERIVPVDKVSSETIAAARKAFMETSSCRELGKFPEIDKLPPSCTVYEHKDFDGKSATSLS